ncbi:AMP-dependent synthetase/ligase [Desulfogranum japonicum]|uniref:AMP-dependent synthetase/ligase n=1 Tax=Desulfogranum japonicum TaxID=231447 RepID=UPI0004101B5A|nr:long-chain fatty acid--CoA ligase [Desulfogranum japonicum]
MEHNADYLLPDEVQTLPGLFWKRVARTPDRIAYRFFDTITEQWQDITWKAMADKVSLWVGALAEEHLKPGERVALMLPNGPNWTCFDLAAQTLGLVTVPLFANDRPENIAYILEETQSKVLLCPGLAYWNDLEPVLDRLTHIQKIITLDYCKPQEQESRIVCCDSWLDNRSSAMPKQYPTDSDLLATIVFTSGTTGPPKGVMLSHRNILENCLAGHLAVPVRNNDIFLSFLPLSHMLERTVGYYLPMMAGAMVAYARSISTIAEDLTIIKPTVLISVPRIFERIYSGIHIKLAKSSWVSRILFNLAVACGWKAFCVRQKRMFFHPLLLIKPLIHRTVARKIQQKLGGRLRVIISGGAPLAHEIARLFLGLDLPLVQGYGLTETSPVVSVNRLDTNDPESVGPPLPGIEVSVKDTGELLVRGSCVMLGYWQNENATQAVIDEQGWLHTGDKAVLKDGYIYITGRLKEILVLTNSEKVPPADLELAISLDPLFDQVMIIGENRPYLTMLGVVQPERWQELCAEHGLSAEANLLAHEKLVEIALARVEQRLKPFPGFMKLKQLRLITEPWTVENGLLTPTLKMKREAIAEHYHDLIDEMYQ